LPKQHGRSWRLVKGHGSLGKVMKPCGAWWRIKEAHRRSYDMSGRNLGRKWGCEKLHSGYSQNTLLRSIKGVVGSQLVNLVQTLSPKVGAKQCRRKELFIPLWRTKKTPKNRFFGDVLVYIMLWDWKKILNINLWRIIRLSMRPTMGLCLHISLERILVYTVLV
jgi:hypothetical protein